MKKIHLGLIVVIGFILASCNTKPESLQEALESIPGVTVTEMEHDSVFNEAYEIYFTQPLDHNNPDLGTFEQRVLLAHVGFDRPMVVELQGYQIWTDRQGELSKLLNANQLTIEHRFFDDSRPDSIPWSLLTIEQAAADQHKVIQAIKKFYNTKWITTGISKGGQTTMYHRYFYPNDVDVSVPYVAPLNLQREDPRIHEHLATVGDEETRNKIVEFQKQCFENKEALLEELKELKGLNNWNFRMGTERALELTILEYPFAFWQWHRESFYDFPDKDATAEELTTYLNNVAGFDFFDSSGVEQGMPFYYQAMNEVGMYSYPIEPFAEYLDDTADITFHFNLYPYMERDYNLESMAKVNDWLQRDAENMLFIYGEYDSWSATAVDLNGNSKCVKFVNPAASHSTRIRHFPEAMKMEIIGQLEEWLEMDIDESRIAIKK